jgi:hypothetical protein
MKTNKNILRKSATMLALVVSGALMFEACAKEPVDELTGRITMTTKATKVGAIVSGDKDVVIDWGDGKKSYAKDGISDGIPDDIYSWLYFTHDYSDAAEHKIVITGNVTKLTCSGIGLTALDVSRNAALENLTCSRNQLTSLDVSRNTALESLDCNRNQIRSLDVSKNTELITLFIVGNQLTVFALNDLFISLPDDTKTKHSRTILIAGKFTGNPGNLECDRSIAEKKGWGFMVDRHE